MADPTTPLLRSDDDNLQELRESTGSTVSHYTAASGASLHNSNSDESTPLLSGGDNVSYHNGSSDGGANATAGRSASSPSRRGKYMRKIKPRWKLVLVAISLVFAIIITVTLVLGFAAPAMVEEYAQQAAVFEPKDLSIETFTDSGATARIKGDFRLDSLRVKKKSVRSIGRIVTWIAGAIETDPTVVKASLPEYGNIVIGSAELPKVILSVRDRAITHVDLNMKVTPGAIDGLRHIATDWAEGRLGQLRVQGMARVALRSGIFSLGAQKIVQTAVLEGNDLPSLPKYQIDKINVHEIELPGSAKAMSADVSISFFNKLPITFTVPPLAFDILVAGCSEEKPFIKLANATAGGVDITPQQHVHIDAQGIVRELPDRLLSHCPGTEKSPLDTLLRDYINGDETIMFIRGANLPGRSPSWLSDLTRSVILPIPFSGKSMGKLVRNFTMADVQLGMPDPMADPKSPAAQPKISATVNVVVNLPKEMNFPIDVTRVRSRPDVFYSNKKLGILDLGRWRSATSKRLDAPDNLKPGLLIRTVLKDAPIWITNRGAFSAVLQDMLLGNEVTLDVRAAVDIEVKTAVGELVIRDIPAQGEVPVPPLPSGRNSDLLPKFGNLDIVRSSVSSILLEVKANVTNPTNYSATVPYVNINILSNGTILAQASVEDARIVPGLNTNISIRIDWSPDKFAGKQGIIQAEELMSQYLSGYNTTLVLRTHQETFPSNPALGSALSKFEVEVPTPILNGPSLPKEPDDGDDGDDAHRPSFVRDATMHLLSSTASFKLLSPLKRTTLFVNHLNVTALYNHTEPVGQILYDLPIALPPGVSETPNLPVDWELSSVGYGAVKDALWGSLKLDSRATVGFNIGKYRTRVWYVGKNIGARVRL